MKKSKTITSAAVAGIMALSFCASYGTELENSIIVNAGQQLGQLDFDDGVGLPWHICESETGKMEFAIKDGKYEIKIVNPGGASNGGEDRWDCQFRHRGLKIEAGHQYEISYEITASNAGKYYTKIGNLDGDVELWHSNTNEGDFGANWGMIQIGANETKKVKMNFTTSQSLDVAEWSFHLGGDGTYTQGVCFPAGTVITFDNMSLIDKTSDANDYKHEEKWERAEIITNQIGYFPDGLKKATFLSDSSKSVKFELYNDGGKKVFDGKTEPVGFDSDSGDEVHIIDFSEYDGDGEGFFLIADGCESRKFAIKEELYSDMLYDSLNYFYQNRSGVEIESKYISSGDADALAREAGHDPDNCSTELVWGYTDSYSLDVTGGWYDAGDHGKYVVNGGISLWTMQNQYERAIHNENANADLYGDGALNIPESGNGVPDILDESRVELEWMMSMMVPEGYKYEGMVHHKVHDEKWTGLAVAPADDDKVRIIKPPTTAATLNMAACAAQGYRLWKEFDKSFAETCLENAEKAYEAALENPSMFAPLDESTGGGAYGDDNTDDEFYWAATELYLATGDEKYYDALMDSDYSLGISSQISGGEAIDTIGSFDWGNVAALGTMSIATVKEGFSDKELDKVTKAFEEAAGDFIKIENEQGYGVPIKPSTVVTADGEEIEGYPWGSNSFVVNTSIVMAYAYDLTGDEEYLNGATQALDYIMGRNPLDICYVTGYGEHSSENPHHRWWSNQIDEEFPSAPAGVLVGGPNSGLQDPWVKGLGWLPGENAPQLCYVDHIEAWCTNECTINWNAPLAWMAGYLTNEATRDISELKYDDGSDDNTEEEEEKPAVTKKNSDSKKNNTDTDKKASDKTEKDDTDEKDNDNDGGLSSVIDKAKDVFAWIGVGTVGLLALTGLISIIVSIIKSSIKKKKAKKSEENNGINE
ncbi:MAG: glycosyl hydrolase family 5 [Ruminococcus sp.]|nr:glycosyl hydrolase family 5 [Ruminococcus sp.]